jgi:hypothetical protein
MEIKFQTKEESNKQQQEAFLKLSKVERFYSFLGLMYAVKKFPTKNKIEEKKHNFVIEIKVK